MKVVFFIIGIALLFASSLIGVFINTEMASILMMFSFLSGLSFGMAAFWRWTENIGKIDKALKTPREP